MTTQLVRSEPVIWRDQRSETATGVLLFAALLTPDVTERWFESAMGFASTTDVPVHRRARGMRVIDWLLGR